MTSRPLIASRLMDIVGADGVVDADYLGDYAIGSFVPVAVARPADADGVAEVTRWALRSGVAIYPSGGRTLTQLGNAPARAGIVLDLTRLNRLVDFQPADLTVSVEAGMTIAELDAALAQDGKHVPIAAPTGNRATVGGTLATGISGPLRSVYGLPRDWLIGINVVGADGIQTKSGGKVVKNVTGYDLNRLYTGSLGTLAIITEATFKLAPAPSEWAVVTATFADTLAAADGCQNLQAQHYAPLGLHILTGTAANKLQPSQAMGDGRVVAIAVVAGRTTSVDRRVGDTVALWNDAANGIETSHGDLAVDLIKTLTDLPAAEVSPPTVCIRVNARPSALRDVLAFADSGLSSAPPPAVIADVGFGGGRLLWWDDFEGDSAANISDGLRKIQRAAASLGGDAVVERCPDAIKTRIDVWGEQPSGMGIMRRVKQQFDPQNILNPGRFVGGL
jgi:glycolate oxidase FAD binding subunit